MKNFNLNFYKISRKFNATNQQIPMKLKRKFYTNADVLEVTNENYNDSEETHIEPPFSKLLNYSKNKEVYYQIILDNKKCKTMYLDEFKIPHQNLAYLICEEWARQKEYVNLHSMQLNLFASSGIRISKDSALRADIESTMSDYILSDQVCFIEPKIMKYIETQEKEDVQKHIDSIFAFLKENFHIELKLESSSELIIFNSNNNAKNREVFLNLLKTFDPWVLGIIEQLVGLTKSPSVSLGLLCGVINPKQAYLLSHHEEYYQMKLNGEVEGHHDISNEMIMSKLYSAMGFYNSALIL